MVGDVHRRLQDRRKSNRFWRKGVLRNETDMKWNPPLFSLFDGMSRPRHKFLRYLAGPYGKKVKKFLKFFTKIVAVLP
jgi:hypothetical protein